jgi:hypothetical protein
MLALMWREVGLHALAGLVATFDFLPDARKGGQGLTGAMKFDSLGESRKTLQRGRKATRATKWQSRWALPVQTAQQVRGHMVEALPA